MPEHVLAHEPALALFAPDDDPLVFYRAIASFAKKHLTSNGSLYLECNEFNASDVAALLVESGFQAVVLKRICRAQIEWCAVASDFFRVRNAPPCG